MLSKETLVCMDERGCFYVAKAGQLHCLGKGVLGDGTELSGQKEQRAQEAMATYVKEHEERFLDTSNLYSPHHKRKLFYSSNLECYCIFVWDENNQVHIHPFRDFEELMLGEEVQEVEQLSGALARMVGMMQYNPAMAKLLA